MRKTKLSFHLSPTFFFRNQVAEIIVSLVKFCSTCSYCISFGYSWGHDHFHEWVWLLKHGFNGRVIFPNLVERPYLQSSHGRIGTQGEREKSACFEHQDTYLLDNPTWCYYFAHLKREQNFRLLKGRSWYLHGELLLIPFPAIKSW